MDMGTFVSSLIDDEKMELYENLHSWKNHQDVLIAKTIQLNDNEIAHLKNNEILLAVRSILDRTKCSLAVARIVCIKSNYYLRS